MNWKRTFAIAILLPFGALTAYALNDVGYWGLFEYQLASAAGWQVFADLVIALVLFAGWMIADARRNGRNVWPYLVATLFLGSFGPLFYLLMTPNKATSPSTLDAGAAG